MSTGRALTHESAGANSIVETFDDGWGGRGQGNGALMSNKQNGTHAHGHGLQDSPTSHRSQQSPMRLWTPGNTPRAHKSPGMIAVDMKNETDNMTRVQISSFRSVGVAAAAAAAAAATAAAAIFGMII